MATTGFWPVKNRLKAAIDYAENPDKTTLDPSADPDLYATLQYAANNQKTDQRMFVSAIKCPKQFAYEHMMRTKQKYGKLGGNVAYHGYQSFRTGEVTPEEAHAIGMETARRMWGNDYEIVVTTHLNTDNLHNHIVVNSVSFRTGRKFENHISDHYRLREISDRVCEEHGISVLRGSDFYANRGRSYWAEKNGQKSHRQLLKEDIERCLSMSFKREVFWKHMDALGYTLLRGEGYEHPFRPLRKELAIAKEIAARYPQVQELLNTEQVMEQEALTQNRKRGFER